MKYRGMRRRIVIETNEFEADSDALAQQYVVEHLKDEEGWEPFREDHSFSGCQEIDAAGNPIRGWGSTV